MQVHFFPKVYVYTVSVCKSMCLHSPVKTGGQTDGDSPHNVFLQTRLACVIPVCALMEHDPENLPLSTPPPSPHQVSSVLLFVKPRVLKDELNTQFREKHPSLPPSLTLSKIRSLKRQALLGCFRAVSCLPLLKQ